MPVIGNFFLTNGPMGPVDTSARQNLVGMVKKALEKALGTYVTNQRI